MPDRSAPQQPALLTPQEAAQRLLEASTLAGWRTQGRDGLVAVRDGARQGFRQQDVEVEILRRFQIC